MDRGDGGKPRPGVEKKTWSEGGRTEARSQREGEKMKAPWGDMVRRCHGGMAEARRCRV